MMRSRELGNLVDGAKGGLPGVSPACASRCVVLGRNGACTRIDARKWAALGLICFIG